MSLQENDEAAPRAGLREYIFMEKPDILTPDIDWATLVCHVARDQVTVELADGSIAIAEVVPKKTPILMTGFAAFISSIPTLDDAVDSFANDIELSRRIFKEVSDPWES